jgi:hypothetical protein
MEDRSDASKARTHPSTVSTGDVERPASRNLDQDNKMESKPTGVDTSTSGPGALDRR